MDYSQRIAERMWNTPDKGELESARERTFIDDIVQKSHIEKELLANLDGVRTAFDGGAGSGRFSILLAKRGIHVTHFDISQPMLDKAREMAERENISDNITFVLGSLENLSAYPDKSFDLVMSFDAPVSYTYPHQERVLQNLVRMARMKILVSVASRLGALPYLANPIQKNQFILNPNSGDGYVRWCIENRGQMISAFTFRKGVCMRALSSGFLSNPEEAEKAYNRGETPWCVVYHFMPDELEAILRNCGVRNIRLAGPGAFARTVPNEILVPIMNDPMQKAEFLSFCHVYDSNPYVYGMGKDNLFAVGDVI